MNLRKLWLICTVWCLLSIPEIIEAGILNQTLEPTPNTPGPTIRPTKLPTTEPTAYPVVSIDNGYLIVITASIPVAEIESEDVVNDVTYFELLFADAAGLDANDIDIRVTSTATKTGVEQECNTTNVLAISYEIISDDNTTYTSIRQTLATGTFIQDYNDGLTSVFSDTTNKTVKICPESQAVIESYTEEQYDDVYIPTEGPTITEQLWSEYLFFGFFTSLLGVVWLWYLRSDVDDDNIYVNKSDNTNGPNNNAGATNAVSANNNNNNNETNAAGIEMEKPAGSSNALLDDDGAKNTDSKLSDYAVKSDDGKLVLDQRDSKRSP